MAETEELGPIDYLVVEFPFGTRDFSGSMTRELVSLVDAEMIRLLDLVVLEKGVDGKVDAFEIEELEGLRAVEGDLAEILADEDLQNVADSMAPGTVAGVLVWENTWAVPFAAAASESGGQLVATGRIPVPAILRTLQAQDAGGGA